jgi:putative ABC transport system permease protein
MALGAGAQDVCALVVSASLRFITMGIGVGALLVCLVGRAFASQVWGVTWYDPPTLIAVAVVLAAVGLIASYVPSARATRVDPAICLRYE